MKLSEGMPLEASPSDALFAVSYRRERRRAELAMLTVSIAKGTAVGFGTSKQTGFALVEHLYSEQERRVVDAERARQAELKAEAAQIAMLRRLAHERR